MKLINLTILALLVNDSRQFSVRDLYKNLMGLDNSVNVGSKVRKHRGPHINLYAQTDSEIRFMDDVENEIKAESGESVSANVVSTTQQTPPSPSTNGTQSSPVSASQAGGSWLSEIDLTNYNNQ